MLCCRQLWVTLLNFISAIITLAVEHLSYQFLAAVRESAGIYLSGSGIAIF